MARDEYLEIDELDTTPEADKVSMALIYLSVLFWLLAIVMIQLKLKQYGVGLFG